MTCCSLQSDLLILFNLTQRGRSSGRFKLFFPCRGIPDTTLRTERIEWFEKRAVRLCRQAILSNFHFLSWFSYPQFSYLN